MPRSASPVDIRDGCRRGPPETISAAGRQPGRSRPAVLTASATGVAAAAGLEFDAGRPAQTVRSPARITRTRSVTCPLAPPGSRVTVRVTDATTVRPRLTATWRASSGAYGVTV